MERLVDKTIGAQLFTATSHDDVPTRAATIVVGGGVLGASIAYHLAEAGRTDVLLLDANGLGSGTTWHAAGLVNGARATATLTDLSRFSRGFYEQLGDLSGIDVNWQRAGSLSLARTDGRVDELKYQYDVANRNGVDAVWVEPGDVTNHWPLVNPAGVKAGLLIPGDGHINPGYGAIALAKLAHERGVTIREGVAVTEILVTDGRVVGVRTDRGDIESGDVVLAAGLWSRDLARTAGANLPLYAAEHVHVRTGVIDGVVPSLPVLRDLDSSFYLRHEEGRLLVGAFEPNGVPRAVSDIPRDGFAEFPADWAHFDSVRVAA